MSTRARLLLSTVLVTAVAACSGAPGGPTSEPRPEPSSQPSSAPTAAGNGDRGIEYPTGPTDIVLRYEEGGGFMMPAWLATQAPIFTLYGDGTIVFRDPWTDPPAALGPVMLMQPFKTAELTDRQIQELLEYALGEGGLAVAKPNYPYDMIADAGTAIFTVNAGGIEKRVEVYALGLADDPMEGMPDAPARKAFAALAERLREFDTQASITTTMYEPPAYRGVLLDTEGFPGEAPIAWPWTEIQPADFTPDPDDESRWYPSRVMTPEELSVLGIEGYEGGFTGMTLIGPDDGKTYSFSLRPLLPGEES